MSSEEASHSLQRAVSSTFLFVLLIWVTSLSQLFYTLACGHVSVENKASPWVFTSYSRLSNVVKTCKRSKHFESCLRLSLCSGFSCFNTPPPSPPPPKKSLWSLPIEDVELKRARIVSFMLYHITFVPPHLKPVFKALNVISLVGKSLARTKLNIYSSKLT